jgi:hypothetical protein
MNRMNGWTCWAVAAGIMLAAAAGGCGRSNDVSGHNTYLSQPSGASSGAAAHDTARDSAAPRVRP